MSDVYAPCSDDSTSSDHSFSEDSLYWESEEKICLEKPPKTKFGLRRRRKGNNPPKAKSPKDLYQSSSPDSAQIKKSKSYRRRRPCSQLKGKNKNSKIQNGRKSSKTENKTESQIPKYQVLQNAKSEEKDTETPDSKSDQSKERNGCSQLDGLSGNNNGPNTFGFINSERGIFDISNDLGLLEDNDHDTPATYDSTIVSRLLHQNSGISQSIPLTRCKTAHQVNLKNENRSSFSKKCARSQSWIIKNKSSLREKAIKSLNSRDAILDTGKKTSSDNSKSKKVTKAQGKVTKIEVFMPRFEKYMEQEKPTRKGDRSTFPTPDVRSRKSLDQNKSLEVVNEENTSIAGNDFRDNLKYLRQKVDALKAKSSRRKWSIDPQTPPVLASKDEDTSSEIQTDQPQHESVTNARADESNTSKALKKPKQKIGTKIDSVKESSGLNEGGSSAQKVSAKGTRRSSVSPALTDGLSPITVMQKANTRGPETSSKNREPDFSRGSSTFNDPLNSSRPKSSTGGNRLPLQRVTGGRSYKQIYEAEKAYRALLEKKKKKWKIADPFAQSGQEPAKLSGLRRTPVALSRVSLPFEEISNETWLERCHYVQQVKSQKTDAADNRNQKSSPSHVSISSPPAVSSKVPGVKSSIPRLPPINERRVIQKTEPSKYRPLYKNEEVRQKTGNRNRNTPAKH